VRTFHKLWCNCPECLRWHPRVPDSQVEKFEAALRAIDTRPIVLGLDLAASTADFTVSLNAGCSPPWTEGDVRFLTGLAIDPWH
jgi:hypothetical protein